MFLNEHMFHWVSGDGWKLKIPEWRARFGIHSIEKAFGARCDALLHSSIGRQITCLAITSFAASPKPSHHKAAFTFPNTLPGQTIEVDKIFDPVAGTLRLTSNSSYIQSGDDIVKLERQEEAFLYKKHGALAHSGLLAKLDTLQPGGKLDVLVSIRMPEGIVYLDKTKHSAEEMRQQSLSLLTLQPVVSIATLLARYGLNSKANISPQRFRTEVTQTDLEKLAFDVDVSPMFAIRIKRIGN